MTVSNADSAIAVAAAPSISCWVIVDPRVVEYDSFDALLAAFAGDSPFRPVWRPTSDREYGRSVGHRSRSGPSGSRHRGR